jgi:TubC N-terminal docking domain
VNTVAELINVLESKGVRFCSHTGGLRVDAPQGTLTDDLRTILAERKPEILAFLQAEADADDQSCDAKRLELAGELIHLFNERASTLEYEAKIPRVEAERTAILEVQSTPQFRQWRSLETRHRVTPGRGRIQFHQG